MGSVFGRDQKAYAKWKRSARPKASRGLTGPALESAVMNIAAMFPDNVSHGVLGG